MSEVKPENVPDEALAAYAAAIIMGKGYSACLAAALNAWPNSTTESRQTYSWDMNGNTKATRQNVLILPLVKP